jgi:uncharacterized protein involved in exopolysaccharide biosynthesis
MNSSEENAMESDFVPSAMIVKAAKKWWVFAALMILGGLAGMLVTRLHKPVYQSQAVITTAVNYAYSGRLEDYELDHIILTVGDIINSTAVREQTLALAKTVWPGFTAADMEKNLTAVRKGNDWILSSRASDPSAAQSLANWWSDAAMLALQKMSQNALTDFHTQAAMLSVESCFSESVLVETAVSGCTPADISQLKSFLSSDDTSAAALRNSILLSNLSFEVTTQPEHPSAPVLYRQNLNVAAGALIGLLIGLAWFFRRGN